MKKKTKKQNKNERMKLKPQTFREVCLTGKAYNGKTALKQGIIDGLITAETEIDFLNKIIENYGKPFAKIAKNNENYQRLRIDVYQTGFHTFEQFIKSQKRSNL